jgi:alkyl sulfatase BDS1-like metallo-beta-lactamase superfamily hydrolase
MIGDTNFRARLKRPCLAGFFGVVASIAVTAPLADAASVEHFDPLGKPPSKFTIELREGLKATLPFEDKRDFEEAKKGFIAEPPYTKIMADAGHVAWDMGSYRWLLQGQDFDSINPSL